MDIFDFLATLPPATLDRLYNDPWTCQAVFQSLPSLAKQLVMRLLCVEAATPISTLRSWIQDRADTQYEQALNRLTLLRFFIENSRGAMVYLTMNQTVQKNLQMALSSLTSSPWENDKAAMKPEKKRRTPREINDFAREQWDAILHFLVGSTAAAEPEPEVIDLLLRTKLMQPTDDGKSLYITDRGYEFMLQEVHMQIWIFMLEYIQTVEAKGLHRDDVIKFLFQLSYCQVNEDYPVDSLTSTQQALLKDFRSFGLLYSRSSSSSRFYTTELAVNLIFGGSRGQGREVSYASSPKSVVPMATASLKIVVETNFKIYAYTTSALHIAMLSVFVDIVLRLPNMVVGFITRESLRSALIHGISATQIRNFLMVHAHPKTLHRKPLIPENIVDQIYLWEHERNRVQYFAAVLIDNFDSGEDFETVLRHAQNLDVCIWFSFAKQQMAVTQDSYDKVLAFIRSHISNKA